jgi:hypothetical protein
MNMYNVLNDLKMPCSLYDMYVILKNGVFWDVTPCGSCKNRRFGGT